MKKLMAFFISCTLAASLTACGGGNSNTEQTKTSSAAANTAASSDAASEASSEEAPSGDNYTLKFALQNGENHPLCQGIAKFGEVLEDRKSVV